MSLDVSDSSNIVDYSVLRRTTDPADLSVRPRRLADFLGQNALKKGLKIAIDAALSRGSALDHVLFFGPPGLGKTTIAQIIANEMGVSFKTTSGPVLAKSGDVAAILSTLSANDVLFIDEIHRMNRAVEEVLYSAMEDFQLDVLIGEGMGARSVRIDLPRFTLVGATTRSGMLSAPLRDRFGISMRMEYYSVAELQQILVRQAAILSAKIDEDASYEIATRSRGTPRISGRLLRRVLDYACLESDGHITYNIASKALDSLQIDKGGLDVLDRKYLRSIVELYGGGPVGVETLAAVLSEKKDMIEDVIEPFLLQNGFIARTPRGRVIADAGLRYVSSMRLD